MRFKIFYIAITMLLSACSDNALEQMPPQVAEYTQVDFEPSWNVRGDKFGWIYKGPHRW